LNFCIKCISNGVSGIRSGGCAVLEFADSSGGTQISDHYAILASFATLSLLDTDIECEGLNLVSICQDD